MKRAWNEHIDWFSRVGQPSSLDGEQVASWDEVAQEPRSTWAREDQSLDIANTLSEAVSMDEEADLEWNDVAEYYRPLAHQAALEAASSLWVPARMRAQVLVQVRWDLIHKALADHFERVVSFPYYGRVVACYEAGHMPICAEGVSEEHWGDYRAMLDIWKNARLVFF